MGRLAVAADSRGFGLGTLLLVDALKRTLRVASDLGICGIEVYALDDEARNFYLKHGFVELADDTLHLYLPMKILQQLIFTKS
jgi:GNAT superfamily N-acetyltransferase